MFKVAMQWMSGFLSAGNGQASSKRLLTILSYVAAIAIAGYCVIHGIVLDTNVMIMMLGLCGVSTTQQILGNKNEVKKVEDDKQSQD